MDTIICGFWDGRCHSIIANDPDLRKHIMRAKKEWIEDGVEEIKILPKEHGLALFKKGMDNDQD